MHKKYIPYLFILIACFTVSWVFSDDVGEKLKATVRVEQKQVFVEVHNADGALEAIVFNSKNRFYHKDVTKKIIFSKVPKGTYSLVIIDDAGKTFTEVLTIK